MYRANRISGTRHCGVRAYASAAMFSLVENEVEASEGAFEGDGGYQPTDSGRDPAEQYGTPYKRGEEEIALAEP